MPDLEMSIGFLYSTFLVLFILALLLIVGTVYIRWRHRIIDDKVERLTEYFYPIVLHYLETGEDEDEVLKHFSGKKIEYAVFEKVVIELIQQLDGQDAAKMSQLLLIDPIFDYHVKQLRSSNKVELLKACDYFSYIRLVNFSIKKRLKELLFHKNRMIAFSASSALMASKDVSDRIYALIQISQRKKISEMALLEMVYKFKYFNEDQRDEEAGAVKELLLGDHKISSDNLALIIRATSEIGYFQLSGLYKELLISEEKKWNRVLVKKALIRAQAFFFNTEVDSYLRELIKQEGRLYIKEITEVLSIFGGEENIQVVLNCLDGKDEYRDMQIIKTFVKNQHDDEELVTLVPEEKVPYIKNLVDIVNHEPDMAE